MNEELNHGRRSMGGARWRLIAALVMLVPLGLGTKLYAGPAEAWVRGSAGGVLYVMFFVWLVTAARPTRRVLAGASIGVFVATCGVEVMQLWRHPALEAVRSTFVGRTLLGSSFAWWDLPHYAIGAVMGWGIGIGLLGRRRRPTER